MRCYILRKKSEARRDEKTSLGTVGRILEPRGTAHPQAQARERPEVHTQGGRRTETHARQAGVRRHPLRPAHRNPVEGAPRGVRQPEQRTQVLPGVGGGRPLPPHLEAGARRVRRDGGHLVEVAERGRVHDEGADGARGGGEKPYRPGKKGGRSGTSSWTGVGSRCR